MSVTATTAFSGPFAPNGSTTAFPFTFVAASATEVQVIRLSAAEVVTVLGGYTVALNTNGTGTVNFSSAPAAGDPIYILSAPSFQQQVTFVNQGSFSPTSLNLGLDQAAIRAIFLKSVTDRAIVVPLGETGSTLPPAATRANKVPAFDLSGNLYTPNVAASDLEILAGIAGSVATVAADHANVVAVAGDLTNINTVAGAITNVNAVGTAIANVSAVAGDLTNINAVQADLANINAVGTDIANINAVAGDLTNINLCAGDLPAINAAPTQAANAAASATAAANTAASLPIVTSPAGVIADVRDLSGSVGWEVGEDGVTRVGAANIGTLNGITGGTIAKLLGTAPLTIGPAAHYLSPLNGQSLAVGEGATGDPFTNAGAVALTTDQPYGNKMFHGGVRPDDINGLATRNFDLTSLVPHIEAALTSASDPTGCGETALGGFQAMLFQLLNSYGMAPVDVPFNLISFAPGQGATAISAFRSGATTLFSSFMSMVTAAKNLAGGNVQMPWHLWMQGESGQTDDGYITQLTALAAEVDSAARGILTQQTDPVITFTYQLDRPIACHWYTEAAKASALIRIVGPMYPFLVAGMRGAQFDNVHRQASAYRLYGATAAVAVFCHYFLKRPWRPLQLSYNARGNLRCKVDGSDLIVYYDVPHGGALAFDSPGVDLTNAGPAYLYSGGPRRAAQKGFYLFNSGGTEKPLNDVKLEGRNGVRLVGASAVAGDKLKIGFKDETLNTQEAVIVNLRDCQGDVITFDDGGKVPVHNWALGEGPHTLTTGELS